jgi:hypothetical protein
MQAMAGCTSADFFDVWMKQQSDAVQGAANAYGEALVMDAAVAAAAAPVPTKGQCLDHACVIKQSNRGVCNTSRVQHPMKALYKTLFIES